MTKKWLAAMLGAAAMALSAGALAQRSAETGWYVGADLGQVDFGSEDDTGFRILGGYQLNRNFAAEVAYSQLFDKGGLEATAWEFSAVGLYPLGNRFSLLGRLGLAMTTSEAAGLDEDETALTFGLGVQYDFSPKLGVRGQWQRYDAGDEEADMLSVGIIYKF